VITQSAIDPGTLTIGNQWQTDDATVTAGAATPPGSYRDVRGNARGPTSYIGATDAPGDGGEPPPPPIRKGL
jgi:hypothetical protein